MSKTCNIKQYPKYGYYFNRAEKEIQKCRILNIAEGHIVTFVRGEDGMPAVSFLNTSFFLRLKDAKLERIEYLLEKLYEHAYHTTLPVSL